MKSQTVEIRECGPHDAASVAALSGELGYPVPATEMERRLEHFANDPNHAVLVACGEDGSVAGWIDVGVVFHLQSGAYCEIGGLVVAANARNNGIGRELLTAGEKWASSRGAPEGSGPV
ncbi:MAG: GNAT family N-acetyltransferase [Acidobacteriaceae bacterium]